MVVAISWQISFSKPLFSKNVGIPFTVSNSWRLKIVHTLHEAYSVTKLNSMLMIYCCIKTPAVQTELKQLLGGHLCGFENAHVLLSHPQTDWGGESLVGFSYLGS